MSAPAEGKEETKVSAERKAERDKEDEIAELKEAFACFDKNNDGTITALELGTVLKAMNQKFTEDQLKKIVAQFDADGNGQIDFSEFMQMMNRQMLALGIIAVVEMVVLASVPSPPVLYNPLPLIIVLSAGDIIYSAMCFNEINMFFQRKKGMTTVNTSGSVNTQRSLKSMAEAANQSTATGSTMGGGTSEVGDGGTTTDPNEESKTEESKHDDKPVEVYEPPKTQEEPKPSDVVQGVPLDAQPVQAAPVNAVHQWQPAAATGEPVAAAESLSSSSAKGNEEDEHSSQPAQEDPPQGEEGEAKDESSALEEEGMDDDDEEGGDGDGAEEGSLHSSTE